MNYRLHIDGLRAIAVLLVLLFHVDVATVSGGYVGVDVFFVISGFLITRLVHDATLDNRFSFASFYARRIRRLFPAAFVCFAATTAAAVWLYDAVQLQQFGASLLYTTISASNIHFWLQSGYFENEAWLKPLLHTWSLSVEEQFYLVWPALVVVASRRLGRVGWALVAVAIAATFPASEWAMGASPEAAFFLTPLRIWEFAVGALLVWLPDRAWPNAVRELGLVMGLAMILYPAGAYDASTSFPGASALLPCAGAALALLFGDARYSGRLLRSGGIVFLGRISYSLYLVHWPLIALYKYFVFRGLSLAEKASLVAVSLALACALWYFVEERFRHGERRQNALSGPAFGLAAAAWTLALTVLASHLWAVPLQSRENQPADVQRTLDYFVEQQRAYARTVRMARCSSENVPIRPKTCLSTAENKPNFLVIGDSYAASFHAGLARYTKGKVHLSLASHNGCRPILTPTTRRRLCAARNKLIFREHDLRAYDLIFLVGAFDNTEQVDELRPTIAAMRANGAHEIVVMGPPPGFSVSVQETLRRFGHLGMDRAMARVAATVEDQSLNIDRYLKSSRLDAHYVSLMDVVCPEGKALRCKLRLPHKGPPLIPDRGHLTPEGAAYLLNRLGREDPVWRRYVSLTEGRVDPGRTATAIAPHD